MHFVLGHYAKQALTHVSRREIGTPAERSEGLLAKSLKVAQYCKLTATSWSGRAAPPGGRGPAPGRPAAPAPGSPASW